MNVANPETVNVPVSVSLVQVIVEPLNTQPEPSVLFVKVWVVVKSTSVVEELITWFEVNVKLFDIFTDEEDENVTVPENTVDEDITLGTLVR